MQIFGKVRLNRQRLLKKFDEVVASGCIAHQEALWCQSLAVGCLEGATSQTFHLEHVSYGILYHTALGAIVPLDIHEYDHVGSKSV